LWSAVRGFEERAVLQRRTAERTDIGSPDLRARLMESAGEQQHMADIVRALLVGRRPDAQAATNGTILREYGA
jgi:hypothetical protein